MTTDDVTVIERLEQQVTFLARAIEAIQRKRNYPLERAHYLLLLRLRDGARSVGELAAELALDSSTVTRQVAAMQRLGLAAKRANPRDGRSALVESTDTGRDLCETMRASRLRRFEIMLADWSVEEREQLTDAVGRLTRLLTDALDAEF